MMKKDEYLFWINRPNGYFNYMSYLGKSQYLYAKILHRFYIMVVWATGFFIVSALCFLFYVDLLTATVFIVLSVIFCCNALLLAITTLKVQLKIVLYEVKAL